MWNDLIHKRNYNHFYSLNHQKIRSYFRIRRFEFRKKNSYKENHRISNIIIIILYSLDFFTSVLAYGLSLKFEWQQVSSSLQDSSQYSGCSE